uniref:Uncharacterized protein n=1 Tax=Utricularia reniformis TaxID=192314 RepID=A0A1Y0B2J2_9LAMI|nr:hypothetical protein AEK19_MT1409 [Utricularia reniformis]ART31604.1 hypothetical protein AEK19_MT1409 [Utricularia reniformis]
MSWIFIIKWGNYIAPESLFLAGSDPKSCCPEFQLSQAPNMSLIPHTDPSPELLPQSDVSIPGSSNLIPLVGNILLNLRECYKFGPEKHLSQPTSTKTMVFCCYIRCVGVF